MKGAALTFSHNSTYPQTERTTTVEENQTQTESVTYTTHQATQDVAALRDKIAESMPNIIPEFLKGDSINSLMESIDQSRALYDRLAAMGQPEKPAEEEKKPEAPEVPAGGQTFTEDLSTLPTAELIRRGLAQRKAAAAR